MIYPNEGDVGRYRLLASWLAVPLFGALDAAIGRRHRRTAAALRFDRLSRRRRVARVRTRSAASSITLPREGGRWVIDAVRPFVPPGSVIVVDDWLDATSLAYGAYVDGSLPDRIVVSGRSA